MFVRMTDGDLVSFDQPQAGLQRLLARFALPLQHGRRLRRHVATGRDCAFEERLGVVLLVEPPQHRAEPQRRLAVNRTRRGIAEQRAIRRLGRLQIAFLLLDHLRARECGGVILRLCGNQRGQQGHRRYRAQVCVHESMRPQPAAESVAGAWIPCRGLVKVVPRPRPRAGNRRRARSAGARGPSDPPRASAAGAAGVCRPCGR